MADIKRLRRTLGALCAVVLTACGSSHPVAQLNLSGSIVDTAGAPIAGATVASPMGPSVQSDANGHYAFATTAAELGTLVLSSPSHATVTRQLPAGLQEADFTMKAYDLVQAVTLPTGSAAPLTLDVSGQSASHFSLSIPADSLVDPLGNAVTGQANVRIAYWDPNGAMAGRPANLLAHSPFPGDNDLIDQQLMTFGMFDISLEQDGKQLQIAANHNFTVEQTLPASLGNILVSEQTITSDTYLWYLDPNTQAWRIATETVFDANTNLLTAALPHLSQWNYDNLASELIPSGCTVVQIANGSPSRCQKNSVNLGGCIQGNIYDKSGKPVSGKGTLWLFSSEGIYDVTVNTDSAGHFCYNASMRAINGSGTGYVTTNTLPNFTSAFEAPDNSSLADPIPSACKSAFGNLGWVKYPTTSSTGSISQWNDCGLVNDSFGNNKAPHPMTPAAPLTQTTVQLCAYCPGTAPSSCPVGGHPVTTTCATAGGNNTAGCAKVLNLGDACTAATAACCPSTTMCADGQCVPLTDTSITSKTARSMRFR